MASIEPIKSRVKSSVNSKIRRGSRLVVPVLSLILINLLGGCVRSGAPLYTNKTAQGVVAGATSGAILGSFSGVGAPLGAAFGGAAGSVIGFEEQRRHPLSAQLQEALESHGVKVMSLGQTYRLVLPEKKLFAMDTPRMKNTAGPVLKLIVRYIAQYQTEAIRVAAYTDDRGLNRRNLALSREWARAVLDNLWQRGINARMMVAKGYGEYYPIADNHTAAGRNRNRRIEITFRTVV